MSSPSSRRPFPPLVAMLCAAAVSGQFIAGKATRDALYLPYLDVTTLPTIVIATSAFSIFLVALSSKRLVRFAGHVRPDGVRCKRRLPSARVAAHPIAPAAAARAVYLQISGLGPMLGSGFWLIASERFDPHTARHQFGRIAGVATLGGLAGALVAERGPRCPGSWPCCPCSPSSTSSAPGRYAGLPGPASGAGALGGRRTELAAEAPASGLRVLAHAAYLRNLAALVLLGTIAAALADYVFKVQAVETFGRGEELLRFFAIYYAAVSLLAFVVQTPSSAAALERFGLGVTTARRHWRCLLAAASAPSLRPGWRERSSRGCESVFRGSLFRTGYEIFYTPVPAAREARGQVDHRRRVRSSGRRGGRRPGSACCCCCRARASSPRS